MDYEFRVLSPLYDELARNLPILLHGNFSVANDIHEIFSLVY